MAPLVRLGVVFLENIARPIAVLEQGLGIDSHLRFREG